MKIDSLNSRTATESLSALVAQFDSVSNYSYTLNQVPGDITL